MQAISDYLKEHHPHYRQPTMRKLYQDIRALKNMPHIGRPGRIEGTRELFFAPMPYVAVYPRSLTDYRNLAHLAHLAEPAITAFPTVPHRVSGDRG
jgi:hypothetical protein